jgi:hypothetical protein
MLMHKLYKNRDINFIRRNLMLKELTKRYIEYFNNKDLNSCGKLFAEDFALEDPVVKRIEGREEVLEALKAIFDSSTALDFIATNIYQDNQTTIIEFVLNLDNTILTGTDIIEWQNNKMKELRAYLDIPKG